MITRVVETQQKEPRALRVDAKARFLSEPSPWPGWSAFHYEVLIERTVIFPGFCICVDPEMFVAKEPLTSPLEGP